MTKETIVRVKESQSAVVEVKSPTVSAVTVDAPTNVTDSSKLGLTVVAEVPAPVEITVEVGSDRDTEAHAIRDL